VLTEIWSSGDFSLGSRQSYMLRVNRVVLVISASLGAAQLTVAECNCARCNRLYAISSFWACVGVVS